MNEKKQIVKPKKKKKYYPKDWERRRRIQDHLYEQRLSGADLVRDLGINQGQLNAIMWGRLRTCKWELAIAEYLGVSWEELFSPNHSQEGAA